jgi:HD-like signal output (HDOD) protein
LVANSPLFGNRATIAAIRHAITHLGVERVRSLSTTIALSFFVRNQPRTAFVRHIWAHSIATAAIVDVLGRLYNQTDLYTAGLTHDLGRLGLLLTVGQKYEQWVSTEVPTIQEANLAERARFGMNHCEAGSLVGHKWGFPVLLRSCMIAHHEPPENQPGDPLSLVQLACRMAAAIGYPEVHQQPEEFPELPQKAKNCKDLAPERIQELVDKRIKIVGS